MLAVCIKLNVPGMIDARVAMGFFGDENNE